MIQTINYLNVLHMSMLGIFFVILTYSSSFTSAYMVHYSNPRGCIDAEKRHKILCPLFLLMIGMFLFFIFNQEIIIEESYTWVVFVALINSFLLFSIFFPHFLVFVFDVIDAIKEFIKEKRP